MHRDVSTGIRRLLTALLGIILTVSALSLGGCSREEVGIMNKEKYGLHVEKDGTITLMGEPFYGFGVNYFAAVAWYVGSETQPTADYQAGLAGLASYNIPFVRFPLGAYYPAYYELYDEDPEKVFSFMKGVLDECQKNNIGVIASLMWWDAVIPVHVGGKRADMGDPDSEVVKYARKYTEDVVSRFADHPAIWGWEIGNEYNLNADLCDPELKNFLWPSTIPSMPLDNVDGFDYYTSTEMRTFYVEIAKVIRKYDTYRMITTGNGEMRPFANAIYKAGKAMNKDTHIWELTWESNTREEFDRMNSFMTPDPIDTLCFHLQSGTHDGSNKYVLSFEMFGDIISSKEYFKAYYETAKKLKKACYFGEFGDMLDMETAPDVIEKFKVVTDAIAASGIQIASLWQFQAYTDEGVSGEKLDVLSGLNVDLKEQGKQNIADYWEKVKDQAG